MDRSHLNILVPVSPGELLDKISILEIKSERMTRPEQLDNVREELALLRDVWNRTIGNCEGVQTLHDQLREVNGRLWDIEDDLRAMERDGVFDSDFVELARGVYLNNDRRFEIKKEVNRRLGSRISEVKSYTAYRRHDP